MLSFIEFVIYYRKYIKGYAHIATPVYRLLQNDEAYKLSPYCNAAFQAHKMVFNEILTKTHPDFLNTVTVKTDASYYGIEEVFSYKTNNNREQSVAYISRILLKPKRKYAVTR